MAYPQKGECRNTGRTHFKTGYVPWNKGLGNKYSVEGFNKTCEGCNNTFLTQRNARRFCSNNCRFLYCPPHLGHKHSEATKLKVSKSRRGQLMGSDNHSWKGGITPINKTIRKSHEYKLWREAVFLRDDYTCIECGDRQRRGHQVQLEADHIKPFALYPELRFAIDNGRTLCKPCHHKVGWSLFREQNPKSYMANIN